MGKLPSFQFYPGDWMKDAELRLCSIFARGLLVDLLCIMFEAKHRGKLVMADGVTPWSDEQIADAVSGGDRAEKLKALNELVSTGVLKRDAAHGYVYSSRLLRDEEIRIARAESGSKGGSKTQANRQANTAANGQAKSSSSSSTSSSTSVDEERTETADAVVANRDPLCPYNMIGHQFIAAFGGTVHLTEKRRKAMRARWKDPFWRENWQAALDKASSLPFFKGSNSRNWKITFDFFLRQDSVVRIIEGNYDGFENSQSERKLTAAEQREQLNARSFQWIRDSAAQADAASGAGRGLLSSSTGEALLLEEHGTANTARG